MTRCLAVWLVGGTVVAMRAEVSTGIEFPRNKRLCADACCKLSVVANGEQSSRLDSAGWDIPGWGEARPRATGLNPKLPEHLLWVGPMTDLIRSDDVRAAARDDIADGAYQHGMLQG